MTWRDSEAVVLKLLPAGHLQFASLSTIAARLGVDARFPSALIRPLLNNTAASLDAFSHHESTWAQGAAQIRDLMLLADHVAQSNGLPVGDTHGKTNFADQYPAAELLSRDGGPTSSPLHLYRAYFALATIAGSSLSDNQRKRIAIQLRLAGQRGDPRHQFMRNLGIFDSQPSLLGNMKRQVTQEAQHSRPIELLSEALRLLTSTDVKPIALKHPVDLKRAIAELSPKVIPDIASPTEAPTAYQGGKETEQDSPPATAPPSDSPDETPTPSTRKPRRASPSRILRPKEQPEPLERFKGKLSETAESPDDEQDSINDPPEPAWILEVDDSSDAAIDDNEPAPLPAESELRAELSKSSRWLRNTYRRTPLSSTRLTHFERQRLIDHLHTLYQGTTTEKLTSLALLGLYLLPGDLDDLPDATLGSFGATDSSVCYERQWDDPDELFTPPQALSGAYEPKISALHLPLPPIFADLVNELAGDLTTSMQLGAIFAAHSFPWAYVIKEELARLREGGRFRLTQPKISAALSLECWIRFQDPLTNFILTGQADQKSPNIHYYQSLPKSVLMSRWHRLTKVMLDDH